MQIDGKRLNVTSLENPLSLYLPLNKEEHEDDAKLQRNFFLAPVQSIKDLNTSDNMNYHKVNISSKYLTVSIRLVPEEGDVFEVYIRPRKKPTPIDFSFFERIPNLSSCRKGTIKLSNISQCRKDPYTVSFSGNVTGSLGLHYIGIRALPKPRKRSARMRQQRSAEMSGKDYIIQIKIEHVKEWMLLYFLHYDTV